MLYQVQLMYQFNSALHCERRKVILTKIVPSGNTSFVYKARGSVHVVLIVACDVSSLISGQI